MSFLCECSSFIKTLRSLGRREPTSDRKAGGYRIRAPRPRGPRSRLLRRWPTRHLPPTCLGLRQRATPAPCPLPESGGGGPRNAVFKQVSSGTDPTKFKNCLFVGSSVPEGGRECGCPSASESLRAGASLMRSGPPRTFFLLPDSPGQGPNQGSDIHRVCRVCPQQAEGSSEGEVLGSP